MYGFQNQCANNGGMLDSLCHSCEKLLATGIPDIDPDCVSLEKLGMRACGTALDVGFDIDHACQQLRVTARQKPLFKTAFFSPWIDSSAADDPAPVAAGLRSARRPGPASALD